MAVPLNKSGLKKSDGIFWIAHSLNVNVATLRIGKNTAQSAVNPPKAEPPVAR